MKGKIIGVSLGPGEPELITLKALKALNAADIVYCPATRSGDGTVKSRALDILSQLPVDVEKVRSFHVPMSRNREEALNAYEECVPKYYDRQNREKRWLLRPKEMLVFIPLPIICMKNWSRMDFR